MRRSRGVSSALQKMWARPIWTRYWTYGPADHLRQGYGGPPKLYAKAEAGHDRGLDAETRRRREDGVLYGYCPPSASARQCRATARLAAALAKAVRRTARNRDEVVLYEERTNG